MNKWVEKSIGLANAHGYLDRLFEVYPIEAGVSRDVSGEIKRKIKEAFESKDKLDLIMTLLQLPKFPIDHPYIPALRIYPHLLKKNPATIEKIGNTLLSMDIGKILELTTQPKSPSRQLGHSFKKWIYALNYPFLNEDELEKCQKVAFLNGSDRALKDFAVSRLGIRNLEKGIDFVLKIKNEFILGEAKFLTDYGGTQNNQFNDAIRVTKIKKDKIEGIAILDGIVWFKSNSYMHRMVRKLKGIALSALLLEEFIKEKE